MELAAQWRAAIADEELRRSWLDTHDDHDWEPISVPGHWRGDAAFADADGPLLYRTRFDHDGPGARRALVAPLRGVFYQGDVWLDGGYVGDTEGYFFPHTFEVTEALAARRSTRSASR
jgi:beta-mannosidase